MESATVRMDAVYTTGSTGRIYGVFELLGPWYCADTAALAGLTTAGSARGAAYFRAAAQLGEQAACALQHAHDLGVLHRGRATQTLTGSLSGCPCVVRDVQLSPFGGQPAEISGRVTIAGIEVRKGGVWRPVAGFAGRGHWSDPADQQQTIRWSTYEVLPSNGSASQLLTLTGAHPTAPVVHDPARAAAILDKTDLG